MSDSCLVERRLCRSARRFQTGRGDPAIASGHCLKGDALTFVQASHTRLLHGADMHEYVLRAVVRRNKAVSLRGIEPLDGSAFHSAHLLAYDAPVTSVMKSGRNSQPRPARTFDLPCVTIAPQTTKDKYHCEPPRTRSRPSCRAAAMAEWRGYAPICVTNFVTR